MTECHSMMICCNDITIDAEVKSSGSLFRSPLNHNHVCFTSLGNRNIHTVDVILPELVIWDSLTTSLNISDWNAIEYVAIGFISNDVFNHIKIKYPEHGNSVRLTIKKDDLLFLVNKINPSSYNTQSIRYFIKTKPNIEHITCDIYHLEINTVPSVIIDQNILKNPSYAFAKQLIEYIKSSIKYEEAEIIKSIKEDFIPLSAKQRLYLKRTSLSDIPNTLQFSYHSLHFIQLLLVYYIEKDDTVAFNYALSLFYKWKSDFYEKNESAYLWYDHGTAERLISFCIMILACKKCNRTDVIDIVTPLIYSHAVLLSSPAFYANNQKYKFHNHAWFQDLSLIIASSFINSDASNKWLDTAILRLQEQLAHLIKPCRNTNNVSVFVENSTGYHFGITRILDCFAKLIIDIDDDFSSSLEETISSLNAFTDNVSYPNSQFPAFGDTYRHAGYIDRAFRENRKNIIDASDAGYLIAQGIQDNKAFQINFIGSSLSSTHKHEDNLSFTLFFDGIEWLIDPSFYSHEYDKPIPKYLRGVTAHNCVHLKNEEYSIEPGKCNVSLIRNSKYDYNFYGHHICFLDAKIKREIIGNLNECTLFIKDKVISDNLDKAYVRLHFNEDVKLKKVSNGFVATHTKSNYTLKIKMPTDEFYIVPSNVNGNFVDGIGGTGFMTHSNIPCVECVIPTNQDCHWTLVFQLKHD